jgi:hypothetical protein
MDDGCLPNFAAYHWPTRLLTSSVTLGCCIPLADTLAGLLSLAPPITGTGIERMPVSVHSTVNSYIPRFSIVEDPIIERGTGRRPTYGLQFDLASDMSMNR